MAKTLKKMTSLTEQKEDAWRNAILLIVIGLGGLFSGREVGIAIAAVVFMLAATHIQRSRVWAAGGKRPDRSPQNPFPPAGKPLRPISDPRRT